MQQLGQTNVQVEGMAKAKALKMEQVTSCAVHSLPHLSIAEKRKERNIQGGLPNIQNCTGSGTNASALLWVFAVTGLIKVTF